MDNTEYKKFLEEYKKTLKNQNDGQKSIKIAASKTKIKEENSNKILVYVGTYKVDKYVSKAVEVLAYENDPKAKYKRYVDIETGNQYNVNMDTVEEFERTHNIIYREVVMNNLLIHYQNYEDVREQFFEGILSEPQEKVVKKLINSSEK